MGEINKLGLGTLSVFIFLKPSFKQFKNGNEHEMQSKNRRYWTKSTLNTDTGKQYTTQGFRCCRPLILKTKRRNTEKQKQFYVLSRTHHLISSGFISSGIVSENVITWFHGDVLENDFSIQGWGLIPVLGNIWSHIRAPDSPSKMSVIINLTNMPTWNSPPLQNNILFWLDLINPSRNLQK